MLTTQLDSLSKPVDPISERTFTVPADWKSGKDTILKFISLGDSLHYTQISYQI